MEPTTEIESPEVFNKELLAAIRASEDGHLKSASAAASKMVRRRIRENGFSRLILPYKPIADSDLGYPPEYVFALAGLTQGTLVRLAQGKVQRVLNTVRDFQIIMQFVDEWWVFWLWQNIKAGTFDNVRGGIPNNWWAYHVIRPRDITVDVGREGRLYDERVATGKMPNGLYVGMLYGEDGEEHDEQIVRERARRKKLVARIAEEEGVDLTVDEIFRPPAGSAPVNQDPPPDDNPEDNPPGKSGQ